MKIIQIIFFFLIFTIESNAQKGLKTLFEEHIFTALDSSKFSLSDIIKKHHGKVIYIDFWASWCKPCRSEMPHSVSLHKKLDGKEIVFVYLSVDRNDNEAAWKSAIEKLKLSDVGEHYRRDAEELKELMKFLYIYSIPHYLIIGKEGQVVNRDALPPSDPRLERQLRKLLK